MTDLEIIKEKLDELGATQQLLLQTQDKFLEGLQGISSTLGSMNSTIASQLEINKVVIKLLENKL